MQRVTRWSVLLPACLAILVVTGAARADDDKPTAAPLDRKAIDALIYTQLREVINHGATLYNSGDWNGCYRLYEGALMSVQPLLGDRKELRERIDKGIANAQQGMEMHRRAFVLRAVLDQVRADLKGSVPAKPKSLWERLGGEKGVTKVVDDFVASAAPDPKVDFTRGGKFKLSDDKVAKMKRQLVEQVSQATGGPFKYEGPDMKTVHKGMGITGDQYDALVGHLKKALEKNKVEDKDMATILAAVNSYRKEIVEPKKPDDKKKDEENKKDGKKGEVRGKVLYQGKPLPSGQITFVGKKTFTGVIGEDGSYAVKNVQPGEYTIVLSTQPAKPAGKPPADKAAPKVIAIPPKYSDAAKSSLTFTVIEGEQTHNIELQ